MPVLVQLAFLSSLFFFFSWFQQEVSGKHDQLNENEFTARALLLNATGYFKRLKDF